MNRNPNTSVGLSLAAQAVYAAKNGTFDANANDHDREFYRNTYQKLQRKYGEALGAGEVLNEMQLVSFASALSKSKAGQPKAAAASRANGAKGGRPCSHANTDGSARHWELRRFRAGHACHSCGRTLGTDGYWYVDADQAPGHPFDKRG